MEWTHYCYFFETEDNCFLYNSLSNSFAELDKETFMYLHKMYNQGNIDIKDTRLKNILISIKALVENDKDEYNKIRYLSLLKRFNNQVLHLTINPTLDCNFSCPYCFEKQHPHIYMTDEVEDSIIDYIKREKSTKQIHITWFGGEPLLAFGRIVTLTRKIKQLNIPFNAGMVTNGYLLTKRKIMSFIELNISFLQITIDGLKTTHDSRRCLKSGGKTFDRILENIALLKNIAPQIMVSVRVNIDETNKEDFMQLYNVFQSKNYPAFQIYPAFVDDMNEKGTSCLFNNKQQAEYLIRLYKEYNLNSPHFFPSGDKYECAVRNRNMLVIGPEGELYKCWNDVGDKKQIIGFIDGRITNPTLLLRYLNGADPFDDTTCQKCVLLPVCDGGCPYIRLRNEYEGKHFNVCSLIKNNMNQFLLLHYYHRKNASL